MRSVNIYLILIALGSIQCNNSRNKNEGASNFEKVETDYSLLANDELINDFSYDEEEFKEIDGIDTILYVLEEVDTIEAGRVSNTSYILEFYNVKDWTGRDPGDFRKLIVRSTSDSLEIIDFGGWVKFHTSRSPIFYLVEDLGLRNSVIILKGYTYASTAPLLTIIGFDDFGPKLIYNKNRSIESVLDKEVVIKNTSGAYSRIYGIDDKLVEYRKSGN